MPALAARSYLLPCLFVLLFGCAQGGHDGPSDAHHGDATAGTTAVETPSVQPSQAEGTMRMADELVRLYRGTLDHPRSYYYLNSERAERLEHELARLSGEDRRTLRFAYGAELLNAGRTAAAIEVFEELLDETGETGPGGTGPGGMLSPRAKAAYETLAIAYLRLGEQENCILNHAAESCILPLRGDGLHTLRRGSEQAAALYEKLLGSYARDYELRWLLNVARMTLAGYPNDVPPDLLIPGLVASDDAVIPRFPNIATRAGVDARGPAGGVSVADFNNDGFLDLLTTAHRLSDPVRLFLHDGRGAYIDATEAAGLAGLSGGLNTVHADYDNDGFEDVLILRGAWLGQNGAHPNSLLHNNGDGTFEDVTHASGLLAYHPSQTAAWGDYDNDGLLDLFTGNEASNPWLTAWQDASSDDAPQRHPSQLYRNNGDGTFTDVAAAEGLELEAFVKGAAWGDVNNDGLQDLYVSIMGGPNRLYINRGDSAADGGRFEEAAGRAGVHEPFFGFPVWFWDYDNDGWEDLFVGSYDLRNIGQAAAEVAREYLGLPVHTEWPRLYRNNHDGTFTDATEEAGLGDVLFAMGAGFGDLDNDGFPDVFIGTGTPDLRSVIPNRMYRNDGGRRFVEVTFDGGFGHIQKGHGIAFADLDRDGDQDIYAVMGGFFEGDVFQNALFENPGPPASNAWVTLRLEGRSANRSAVGARVRVTVAMDGGRTRSLYHTVSAGSSFGASSLQLEIGLGAADHIAELQVTWPDRAATVDTFTNLAVNQTYHVIEGDSIEALAVDVVPFAHRPSMDPMPDTDPDR